jgi:Zn-dependent protease with chaperone function
MISALKKISSNSYVSSANDSISSFFIAVPKRPSDTTWTSLSMDDYNKAKEKERLTSIWDSHPSIADRIARLQNY